ncbi:MAG: hypothetical protein OEZ08_13160, partial [Betaproteobacteria bacterium]|nr:hypothetical protein [Betaproteobacteria bacterium]
LVNPAYLKVLKGAVGVTNSGGTVVFGTDTAATVAFAAAMAEPVFVSALPPTASGPFANLATAPTAAAGTPSAASGAPGAAAGAVPAPTTGVGTAVVVIGVGAAVLGAAAKESSATTHH